MWRLHVICKCFLFFCVILCNSWLRLLVCLWVYFCAIYFGMSFTCFLLFLLFNLNFFALVCLKKKKKRSCCMSLLYLTVWISCSIKMFFHTQFSCSLSSTDQNKYVFLCLVPVPNRPTTPLAPGALVPPPRPSSRPKLPAGKLTGINEIVMETYVLHTFIAVQIISIYSKRHLSESL